MLFILPLFMLASTVTGSFAAVDIDGNQEWDPCKTDLTQQQDPYDFTPPNCVLVNCTTTSKCVFFSCRSKLPESNRDVGYFRIRGHGKAYSISDCFPYPRLPPFTQILDLSYQMRKRPYRLDNYFEEVSDLRLVQSLILIQSGILDIDQTVLEHLINLECINMDKCIGTSMPGENKLYKLLSLSKLKYFSARYSIFHKEFIQNIVRIPSSGVVSLWLPKSKLVYNKMLTGALSRFKNLTYLDLNHNDMNFFSYSSESLQTLDLSESKMKAFPQLCVVAPRENLTIVIQISPRLSHLNLSSNEISNLTWLRDTPPFKCMPNLQFLDLGNNKLQSVGPIILKHFLREIGNLQGLILDHINLHLVDQDAFVDIFGHLAHIQTLSLSSSKLEFVSKAALANFTNMTTLLLRDNSITWIPEGCFDQLHSLQHLDLAGNKINFLSPHTFSDELKGRFHSLDLSRNPLTCDCELLWLRDWFFSERRKFASSASEYKCHNYRPIINLSDFNVSAQSCLLSEQTSNMIIFCCSLIAITLALFLLLLRYRWHLRLVLYEAFRGGGDVRRQYLTRGNFQYDVFMSYAREDLQWVRHHLMPQLEDHLGLRLCIHDRQFIPGNNIVDNIVDCVGSSKKILMVFSKHFVRSQWCQFELAYCLNHVLEHEDALIIVCVDDVTSYEITSAMMAVLKTTTYIQWANHADAIRSFWGRLEIALNEVLLMKEHGV